MPLEAVNDFVIRFANVNGSGSASANEMFARAIMRMGVTVAPRNVFPSNIQGLPTWYEIRVSAKGYLGARGGTDFMVAMNPQTFNADVASIEPDGYLLYDSTRAMPPGKMRTDINVIGVPLTPICNKEYTDPRQRQLFKNIICLGVLSGTVRHGLRRGRKADRRAVSRQGQADPAERACAASRQGLGEGQPEADRAAHQALERRRQQASCWKATRRQRSARSMAARPCAAGIRSRRHRRWPKSFATYCKKFRHDPATGQAKYAIVQAEDELASIGMVIGAAWNGARAFTATSGPGISLMQEFLGLAYFAEIPGGGVRRAARRPLDRHADAHAAVRHSWPAPTPRTATPSMRC